MYCDRYDMNTCNLAYNFRKRVKYSWLSTFKYNNLTVWNKQTGMKIFKKYEMHKGFMASLIWLFLEILQFSLSKKAKYKIWRNLPLDLR